MRNIKLPNRHELGKWLARVILVGILALVAYQWYERRSFLAAHERIWAECGKGASGQERGKLNLDRDCFARHVGKWVKKRGVQEALGVVTKVGELLPYGECHLGAHMVGWAALKKFGSPARAFQEYQVESACSAGYTHGVVEEFLRERPGVSLASITKEVCAAPVGTPAATEWGQWQCTHGFGHVVMAFTDYDLPASLTVCDEFADENRRYGCGYGVFMENILAGHFRQEVTSDWTKKDDPLFPCLTSTVPERYQGSCFEWAPTQIVRYRTQDAIEALQICTNQATEQLRYSCYKGMAREMATTLNGMPEQIVVWCMSLPGTDHEFCLQETMVYYVTAADRLPRGTALCNALPADFQNKCAQWIGQRLSWMVADQEERRRWCNSLIVGQEHCTRAAGLAHPSI